MSRGNHPPLTLKDGLLSGTGPASWFGTRADTGDDGIGSTGFNSIQHPDAPYISLPIAYWEDWDLEPFQEFTVEYQGRQVETFLGDKGPGGTPEADRRLIDLGPSVARRLLANEHAHADDITDRPVTLYSRKNEDGTWPVRPKEKRY